MASEQLSAVITDRTRLVSIMFSNNEIGTIEPIAELARVAHSHGAIFHTDAVQAIAHTPIDVKAMGIDMLSASAHKFNGPKGIGFLYIRKGVKLRPLNDGGAQEFGMRAGTENIASIVGMAKALEISCCALNENAEHILKLENTLLERLRESGLDFVRNGAQNHIPGNISVSFKDADGEAILHRLDLMGICVSTGSACNSVIIFPIPKTYVYANSKVLYAHLIKISAFPKESWIEQLANYLGPHVVEGHNTPLSDMYENILSVNRLNDLFSVSWANLNTFFDSLYEKNRHLSYFWMQRGIVYRNLHQYEQAENALTNAEQVHGFESYQIKHAHSKNQLEWGLALCRSNPTFAQGHFDNGCSSLLDLILDTKYRDAIHYSVHTYLDMNMKYATAINMEPTQDQWTYWKKCLSTYIESNRVSDKQLKYQLINEMFSFAKRFNLPFDLVHYRNAL